MPEQVVIKKYDELDEYLRQYNTIMFVCGQSVSRLEIGKYFEAAETRLGVKMVRFSDFQPNPTYESVVKGVELFRKNHCRAILAIGGGSAMDVAKCVKLYANMDDTDIYLKQSIVRNDIPFWAIPTTAGTGSEATRFAVIYYNGEKQSVADESVIPSVVLFDPALIRTLPEYQKKATLLDALCHAIESFWSVHSTQESREYAKLAMKIIMDNTEGYLLNDVMGIENMLHASNLAGKAINITQTTAGHAMCYKLTSLYGIAHGHAAALCVSKLYRYMAESREGCIDIRGKEYLAEMFSELEAVLGGPDGFDELMNRLNLEVPCAKEEDYEILIRSVNETRLKNNPIELDENIIGELYRRILERG